MKIALISQEYPPETARGGIGSQTYSKAKGLSALGHEVFVISRSVDSNRSVIKDGAITIIRIPGFDDRMPEMTDIVQWISHSLLVAEELEFLDKSIGLDIIDIPEWAAEGYTYLLNRTLRKSAPVVIHLHGPLVMFGHILNWPDMNSNFYKIGTAMEATCVQLAEGVYSSGNCSTNWIRSFYHPGKEYIPVIHSGVDTKKFAPQQIEKNSRPTILFIGKITENKGVEELVEAAGNLTNKFPDLQLRLIGRGETSLIRKLHEKAIELGAPDLLDFAGFINKENLPLELSRAHIFACPSWYEGGPGFVFLEAMACELPVIGCSGSGVDEIVTSGLNGILVPPKSTVLLQQAIFNLLSDTHLLKKLGTAGRDYVVREADSNSCILKLEAYYKLMIRKAEEKLYKRVTLSES
jgi:glycosyltransferase involved in cell wall biosynthesis